jgi:tetratricopeptide (TPR) repeat protein
MREILELRHKSHFWYKKTVGLFCILLILFFAYLLGPSFEKKYYRIIFAFSHSAHDSLMRGNLHLNAINPSHYDITEAQYYLEKALELEPKMPLVRHQLGRIAFIEGNFTEALSLLDQEINLSSKPDPSSYYVRALIKGYMGDYPGAAKDYEQYFSITPATWGSINDYSWVLMKDNLPEGAHEALAWGLKQWPGNAWLLSSHAIALYELRRYAEAKESAEAALVAIDKLTPQDWLVAYPGNDPKIASVGIETLRNSVLGNLKKINEKLLGSGSSGV